MKTYLEKTSVILLAITVVFSLSTLQGQPPGTKYGKVTESELTMTDYDKDPGAAAVVIFDVGLARFDYNTVVGFQVVFERHTRIKILNKEGYEHANVAIPYYWGVRTKDEVRSVKAFTWNLENGKPIETKLEKSDILDEKISKTIHQTKFALPNVREGSVIEYSYQIVSNNYYIPEWEFRQEIPIIWTEYTTAIPDFFSYVHLTQGYDPFEAVKTSQENRSIGSTAFTDKITTRLQMNMPAFREEPFLTSKEDVIEKVEFQLSSYSFPGSMTEKVIPTWAELAKELEEDEDFGKFIKKNKEVQALAAMLTADLKEEKDKIAAIHQHLKSNFQWNDYYRIWSTQSMSNLLKTRTGNGAELNLLLVALLRDAGINANPVILSTRSNGKINSTYPLLRKFNHVVAYIKSGDKVFAIDAIDPMISSDMITFEDLNGTGLLIKDGGHEWVTLGENIKESSYHSINATLDEGALKGTITTAHRGYGAAQMRNSIKKSNTTDAADAYFKSYFSEVNLKEPKFENPEDANASLKGAFQFTSPAYVEDGGDFIYINPMLGFGLKENPFKKPERAYPVDFAYPADDIYQFNFQIPPGYTLAEAPKPVRVAIEDGSLRCDYIVESKPTEVKINYRLMRKRVLFKPEEYASLKSFYEQVATQCGGQIVLKKADE